jgi:hypothetical protein
LGYLALTFHLIPARTIVLAPRMPTLG